MTGPADIIREALLSDTTTTTADVTGALAALTELEQQLAAQEMAILTEVRRGNAAEADRDRWQRDANGLAGVLTQARADRDRYREALTDECLKLSAALSMEPTPFQLEQAVNFLVATIPAALTELAAENADIQYQLVEAQEWRERAARLGDTLRELIVWNERWPSHRVYGSMDIERVAAEIDAVVAAARAALAGTEDMTAYKKMINENRRYREALEQIEIRAGHHSPRLDIIDFARAALAAPDTPPDA